MSLTYATPFAGKLHFLFAFFYILSLALTSGKGVGGLCRGLRPRHRWRWYGFDKFTRYTYRRLFAYNFFL